MDEPEKPPRRRVVQVAVASGGRVQDDTIVALCDDATMWLLVWGDKAGAEHWVKLANVPQGN